MFVWGDPFTWVNKLYGFEALGSSCYKEPHYNFIILYSPQSNAQLLPNTIELLVYAYANVDQSIRLAASENLHKLLKVSILYMIYIRDKYQLVTYKCNDIHV